MSEPLVRLERVTKVYRLGEVEVLAIREVNLTLDQGEFVAVMGPSGSGKSTLLHLIGFLDRPTGGRVLWEGRDVASLRNGDLTGLRGRQIGFVFQTFNLIPSLTAVENVELPLVFLGMRERQRRRRAEDLLGQLGLGNRLFHRPTQLSGGEQQRVAIARALAADPALILADEPTGNLDSASRQEIMEIIANLHREGKTVVAVTHDPEVAGFAEKTLRMRDGKLAEGE